MRINQMITYKKMPWSLVKFLQLILEGNIWYHFTQFVWGYSPICVKIFATLYEDIRHFVWGYSPICMKIFATLYKDIRHFVWGYSPICMKIFATLYEDIRHFKNKKETGPSKLLQAKDVWDRYWERAIQLFCPFVFPVPNIKNSLRSLLLS